jgi:hypothetical protein
VRRQTCSLANAGPDACCCAVLLRLCCLKLSLPACLSLQASTAKGGDKKGGEVGSQGQAMLPLLMCFAGVQKQD